MHRKSSHAERGTFKLAGLTRACSAVMFGDLWFVKYVVCREEIEKQKAKERYMKLHLEGKTDQARADLARLAIIKKQREEAARKREDLRKGKVNVYYVSILVSLQHQSIHFV